MNSILTPEVQEVLEAVHYRPAVSIILPFEPKMSLKSELTHSLKVAADKVEEELRDDYPAEMATLVMQKLRAIINSLNFNTHKKSVAIYVSPLFEKVLYLDIAVEERIIVDESFEIRDLVFSKKQVHKYLVLLLSAKESRIFLGNTETFVRIVSDKSESVSAYANHFGQKVANFSEASDQREIVMDKFLHHIDNTLDIILNAYRLPLFVVGTERISGHFKQITRHARAVIEFVHGNYENASIPELREILKPFIADWNKVKQKDLLNQLEEAAGTKKLAVGINDVWHEAGCRKGRLLLVEKNYMVPAQRESNEKMIYQLDDSSNKFSYIKDAVDDVIEKVLEYGGDVEFVDKNLLKDYHRIALVLYN
jgi:hypothetical protein